VNLLLLLLGMDASAPVFLGWSGDGSMVALAQHGVHDGSGFPFSYLWITGPRGTDRYFYEYSCYEEETSEEWLASRADEAAKAAGIPGDNTGKKLEVKLTDTTELSGRDCPATLKKYSCGIGAFSLEESQCNETYDPYVWPRGTVKGLWKDREVFFLGLEGNGFSWWLEEAYSYRGKIALVLGHLEPGFEGPDTRFNLVVFEFRE
jgi:hypothetical protein